MSSQPIAAVESPWTMREHGKVLYVSAVDVSIGNGPGVNEREFIIALYDMIGDRAHFLIPRPASKVKDLPVRACTFSLPHRRHHPLYYPGHIISQARLAGCLLSKNTFDVVLFRLDVLPLVAYYMTKRFRGAHCIKTLGQGVLNILDERGGWFGRQLNKVNHFLIKRIVEDAVVADSVTSMQVDLLQRVLEVNPSKIVCIDNAVNTSRFKPAAQSLARANIGLAHLDPVIGYVGTRPWERGGMQIIEVCPRLLTKYPKLGIVILGDGKELSGMKRRARELGVEDHCYFAGYVPFDQVPTYINALDVGVSISFRPDRSAASELKVRQYLACGKPVVLSPGSNEFVSTQNLGSTAMPDDLGAIAVELARWLSLSREERESFCQRAAAYMRDNFSYESAVARRFALWEECLALRKSEETTLS